MRGSKILVIDANENEREGYKKILQKKEFEVFFAEDGLQAFSFIRDHRFDLILTEIMIPDYNGLELIGVFREEKGYESIPIIIVTAQEVAIGNLREKCLAAGATKIIRKPFEKEDFLNVIKRYLEK